MRLESGLMLLSGDRRGRLLVAVLVTAIVAYVVWKIAESPSQAVQFTFNGLSVGAVYALLAMGFTLVYSTVWFFDMYYGAAAALGAYGVFYLRSQESLGGQYAVNEHSINVLFAVLVAAVVAWALHTAFHSRFRERYSRNVLRAAGGLLAAGAGAYTWLVLAYPKDLHLTFAPAIGVATALAAYWLLRQEPATRPSRRTAPGRHRHFVCHRRCAGGLLRVSADRDPGVQAIPELGRLLLAGRDRGAGSVPRSLRVHAQAVQVPPRHARRLSGRTPCHHRH